MSRVCHVNLLLFEELSSSTTAMNKSLKVLSLTALGLCGFAGAIAFTKLTVEPASANKAEAEDIHWSYRGAEGPEYWGELTEEFSTCSSGSQQSPIDLATTVDADLEELAFDYQPVPLSIVNNGHTIQVNYAPGSSLVLDGQTYDLLQFHFHDPSEHAVDGSPYPMEAHLVHQNAETGELAVVGILLEIGDENSVLQPIWDNMPEEAGPPVEIANTEINVAELLPADTNSYYRYFGSLTTPPCSETVNWLVLKEPVTVSFQQVEHFAATVGENARPVQTVGRRFVLE